MHCTYLHAAQFNLLSNIVQTAVCNPWFTVTCNGYFILFYCYIFVTFVTDFSVMFVSVLWVRFRNNNNDDTDNYSVWCSAVTYSRTLFLHLYCSFTQVQQVQYKLCSTVHRCLQHKAPHHSTWWTAASTPQTLLVASTCGPPAVRTATPAFDVRSSGLFCGWPGRLELVNRLSSGSDTFFWQFSFWFENFSFLVILAYTAH